MPAPRPFNFDELGTTSAAAADATLVRTFSAEDLSSAQAEGVAEGRRLAMESIAADEAAQLKRIGDCLESAAGAIETEIENARLEILAIARVYLEEVSAALACDREIEAADDLLRRLTEHSEDRRTMRLILSAKSLPRLRERLENLIDRRGVGDFVVIEGDNRLSPGEARIEWRGGRAERGRAEISAAIAALFDHLNENRLEAGHERA